MIILDIETSGFSQHSDSIIEVGAIKTLNGKVVDEFSALCRPKRSISPHITYLTGITNAQLLREGREVKEVLNEFLGFVEEQDLIAYNSSFDKRFLQANDFRFGPLQWIDYYHSHVRHMDLDTPDKKLQTLKEHLGISSSRAHRALDDARTLWKIIQILGWHE